MMPKRLFFLAAFGAACACASAQNQPKPTLWVWADNPANVSTAATTNCDVIAMRFAFPAFHVNQGLYPGIVRTGTESDQYQSAFQDGKNAADEFCNTAPTNARIAVMFYAFGYGARAGDIYDSNSTYWNKATTVLNHPDDLLPSCPGLMQFKVTPWPDRSKAECAAWMRGFCEQYRARQRTSPGLKSPELLLFDYEVGAGVGSLLSVADWSQFVSCLMTDPRSGTGTDKSTWKYIPAGLGARTTLAQSYKDAKIRYDGDPSDTTLPLLNGQPNPAAVSTSSSQVQQLFASWINGVYTSVATDVFDSALRQVADTYFPGSLFGNYNHFAGDGLVSDTLPPYKVGSPFGAHSFCNVAPYIFGSSGYRRAYETFAGWSNATVVNQCSLDAPVYYGFGTCSGWVAPGENFRDEYFRFVRGQNDAINFSFDETRRSRVLPWILGKPDMVSGTASSYPGTVIDDNWYRDLYSLGRAQGIRNWQVFQPSNPLSSSDKAAIDVVMGDIWNINLGCVNADLGTLSGSSSLEQLGEIDGKKLEVNSTAFAGGQSATCVVKFKLPAGYSPSKLKLVFEGHATYSSGTPVSDWDIVIAARPWLVPSQTYFHSNAIVLGGSTLSGVPTYGELVLSPGSNFVVPQGSSGTCSATGNEVWVWVGSQINGGVVAPFTLRIENLRVYGYQ